MRSIAAMEDFPRTRMFCYPGFPYGAMFGHAAGRMPEPFAGNGAKFFLRGSTALWQGLRLLEPAPGRRSILFPAYHCGVELDVLLQAGFHPVFYRVDREMRIDPDEVGRLAGPDTCGLYIIHYFGFPQPVEELAGLCAGKDWYLIEDCAQALFARSGKVAVGSAGDIAIFSLHKFLPLPIGGALLVNRRRIPISHAKPGPSPFLYSARQTIHLLGRDLVLSAFMNTLPGLTVRRFVSRWIRSTTLSRHERRAMSGDAGARTFIKEWRDSGPAWLSLQVLRKTSEREVVQRRRRNFAALHGSIKGCGRIQPLFDRLEEGACPLYFPVTVSADPDGFLQFCHKRGVLAHFLWRGAHPAFPAAGFPEECWLRNHVVVLPVHQGLKGDDLALLRGLILDWEGGRQ